jgi:hypothetical protein
LPAVRASAKPQPSGTAGTRTPTPPPTAAPKPPCNGSTNTVCTFTNAGSLYVHFSVPSADSSGGYVVATIHCAAPSCYTPGTVTLFADATTSGGAIKAFVVPAAVGVTLSTPAGFVYDDQLSSTKIVYRFDHWFSATDMAFPDFRWADSNLEIWPEYQKKCSYAYGATPCAAS